MGGPIKQAGGLAFGPVNKPGQRNRRANAEPSGGGGGIWRREQDRLNANRRAIATQAWVQDKISEGDIDGGMAGEQSGTSIFDPVICELAYRWFCPPGGLVLDPFCGGSVRGVVAARLGRPYVGVDLRPEQVAANEAQGRALCPPKLMPRWLVGDSVHLDKIGRGLKADFVFSCPPFWSLEVYSEDPRDLSTMDLPTFYAAYAQIIAKSCALLKDNRFACFVVGEVRDANGFYVNLVGKTVEFFEAAGAHFYNEAILVTAVGSLPIRTAKQFVASRKLGKTHQSVLVFCKGDPRKATAAIGAVEFGALEGLNAAAESSEGATQ